MYLSYLQPKYFDPSVNSGSHSEFVEGLARDLFSALATLRITCDEQASPKGERVKPLPSQDSNLETEIQILVCYHYTTGQTYLNILFRGSLHRPCFFLYQFILRKAGSGKNILLQ